MDDDKEHGRPAREPVDSRNANGKDVPSSEEIVELHGRDVHAPWTAGLTVTRVQ
ncbi:MAG: hypothetical protein AMXMBFR82_21460 [Candidatus Hydrogenedentota bacterium]